MRVRVARTPDEIRSLRSFWEHLYDNSATATVFQSFAWNWLAATHFADREAPYVVVTESESGAALVPAAIAGGGRLRFMGECLFDYRDVLLAGDPAVLAGAWEELAKLQLPLVVTALRGEPSRELLAAMGPKLFCNAPAVRCAEMTAERFIAGHVRLGRYRRRLQRCGVFVRQYDGRAGDLLRWLYRRKAAQFAGSENNIFRDERRIEFIVAAAASQPDRCAIFTLESGEQTIAGLVTFLDRRVRRFYTVYFDPAWARDSPGTVLLFEATYRTLAAGLDCDYMTGEQPHKMRFATSKVPLFRIEATADDLTRAAGKPTPVAPAAA